MEWKGEVKDVFRKDKFNVTETKMKGSENEWSESKCVCWIGEGGGRRNCDSNE